MAHHRRWRRRRIEQQKHLDGAEAERAPPPSPSFLSFSSSFSFAAEAGERALDPPVRELPLLCPGLERRADAGDDLGDGEERRRRRRVGRGRRRRRRRPAGVAKLVARLHPKHRLLFLVLSVPEDLPGKAHDEFLPLARWSGLDAERVGGVGDGDEGEGRRGGGGFPRRRRRFRRWRR